MLNCAYSLITADIVGNIIIKGELKNDGGKSLMDFTEFTLKLNIGNYKVHLDNLFEGDPVLSKCFVRKLIFVYN